MGLKLSERKYVQNINGYNHENNTVVIIEEITPIVSHLIEGLLYRLETLNEETLIVLLDKEEVSEYDVETGFFIKKDLGKKRSKVIMERYSGLFKTRIGDFSYIGTDPKLSALSNDYTNVIPIYTKSSSDADDTKKIERELEGLKKMTLYKLTWNERKHFLSNNHEYTIKEARPDSNNIKIFCYPIYAKYNAEDYVVGVNYYNGYYLASDETVPKLIKGKKKELSKQELFTYYATISQSMLNVVNSLVTNEIGLRAKKVSYNKQGVKDIDYLMGYSDDNIFHYLYANEMEKEFDSKEANELGQEIFKYLMDNWEELNEEFNNNFKYIALDFSSKELGTWEDKAGYLSTERIEKLSKQFKQALNYVKKYDMHKGEINVSELDVSEAVLTKAKENLKDYEVYNYFLEQIQKVTCYITDNLIYYKSQEYPITTQFMVYVFLKYGEDNLLR